MLEALWSLWTSYPTSPTTLLQSTASPTRIFPEQSSRESDGSESLDVWGFEDTQFRGDANGVVEVTGIRYPLSGQKLPSLLPWISNLMEVQVPGKLEFPSTYPPKVPQPLKNERFLAEMQILLTESQISFDPLQRLRHGHGHTQAEMFAIKHGQIRRVPDVILFPELEDQVIAIVQAASRHDICLIPYGGGTNVSEALQCPYDEIRVIVSVDMRRMNKIQWIDKVNRMACIEAGAVGRHIVADLALHGYTMGHEPDSIEFSTLGGWIATNASGMKKNKYGNIEDIVQDITVVTTKGILRRNEALPRESVGSDIRQLIFGSEGSMGIVTSAIVKLFPLPEVEHYGSVLFPSFEDGVAFMYDLTQAGAQPASARLVDNMQFQMSIALKPASTGLTSLISRVQKLYVTSYKGFDPQKMVACTLVFEGTATGVAHQESNVYKIAAIHKGMKAGEENGKRGYLLTYNIAYIRDFSIGHYVLAESFETSVPWSRALELCTRVKDRVQEEHNIRKLPGKPFITCRITQVYDTGCAVYFYFAYFFKGVINPSQVYTEIEKAARDEILLCGGSLSHHHGVGKLRKEFFSRVMSSDAMEWRKSIKQAVDPKNVFGCGNIV